MRLALFRLPSVALGLSLVASSLLPVLAYAAASQGILSQVESDHIIDRGESAARGLSAKVCIAVVDPSGLLVGFKRMDDAPPGCIDSSILKARAAALYRAPTVRFMERANGKEPAIAQLPGMIALGGGTPVERDGAVVGAVGVSGSANPNEVKISEQAAAAGL